jgi:hypothetical protein
MRGHVERVEEITKAYNILFENLLDRYHLEHLDTHKGNTEMCLEQTAYGLGLQAAMASSCERCHVS